MSDQDEWAMPTPITPKTPLDEPKPSSIDPTASVDSDEFEFDFDEFEDTEEKKKIFTVYGHKNDGKTTISYGIPEEGDKILVFSFDNKSKRPTEAEYITKANLKIRVINAIQFVDASDDGKYLATNAKTLRFIVDMLNQAKEKFAPDWVMFDGTEAMSRVAEMAMRYKNNLKPYQGIANRSLWQERKQFLTNIHRKSVNISNKGVIYTMYSQKDEIVIDGNTEKKTDVPKWVGSIMEETDVTIKAIARSEGGKRVFRAQIEGSKLPAEYADGLYDVTGIRFYDAITKSKRVSN